jgi:predicted nucleic acid-binding protein
VADLLIDTDIFVDHIRGSRRLATSGHRVWYSVMTRCELFAGARPDEEALRTLLAPFHEILVGRRIAERAGKVRRETGARIADAIIAATALEHDLMLLTRNRRHFERIPDLRLAASSPG